MTTLTDPTRPRSGVERDRSGLRYAHYHVETRLGGGGMGEVYLAFDQMLDRHVALKFVSHDVSDDPARREQFLEEARAQGRLSHPNVCPIFHIGEDEGELFFAMEYVEGETLKDRLARGRLGPAEAIELVRQAALGLREAERHGFIHRDVKPSNLMIDRHGVLKLLDFGVVKRAAELADDRPIGTPQYMAPEQAASGAVDFRADIYSLGLTLEELITGRVTARSELPPGTLRAVRERMTAARAEERFQSYDELLQAFEGLRAPVTLTTRWYAYVQDLFFATFPMVAVFLAGRQLTRDPLVMELLLSLVYAGYVVTFLARRGRTPGMGMMGLEAVACDRVGPLGFRRALVRYLWQWLPVHVTMAALTTAELELGPLAVAALGSWWIVAGGLLALTRPDRLTPWDLRSRTFVRRRLVAAGAST